MRKVSDRLKKKPKYTDRYLQLSVVQEFNLQGYIHISNTKGYRFQCQFGRCKKGSQWIPKGQTLRMFYARNVANQWLSKGLPGGGTFYGCSKWPECKGNKYLDGCQQQQVGEMNIVVANSNFVMMLCSCETTRRQTSEIPLLYTFLAQDIIS